MTRAGLPATITLGGTARATTLPAPMTDPAPMLTPLRMSAFIPMKTSSPMVMGAVSAARGLARRCCGSRG